MRRPSPWAWAAPALLLTAAIASATAPVPIVMGPSRDGSLHELQRKLDHLVGPGRVDARSDYIGARAGDPDPWFWVNNGVKVVAITLVDRKSPHGVVGWYRETGGTPVIDGVDDGVVLEDWRIRGMRTVVRLPASVTRFGFYLANTCADDGRSYCHFTNRLLNDPGPGGLGEEHAPLGGDMQMLVYDVSRWLGSDTWVVACESSDSGARVGHGRGESDNDYSDIVFTVSGLGATPALGTTFGSVKSRFR